MQAGVFTAKAVDPTGLSEARRPFDFKPGAAHAAQEKVWSAVILASNSVKGERPLPVPAELAPFAGRLGKFFGCDQFEILGSATKVMDEQTERWLVPTQNFWVGAKSTHENNGYRLKLEFYHDKRLLIETEAMLGPKSPLFIRGPVHKRGQIIMIFEVKP